MGHRQRGGAALTPSPPARPEGKQATRDGYQHPRGDPPVPGELPPKASTAIRVPSILTRLYLMSRCADRELLVLPTPPVVLL